MTMYSQDPQSGYGNIELPIGLVDEEGNIVRDVTFREITGEEEDILASDRMPVLQRMNALLSNCIVQIGSGMEPKKAVLDMTSGDRMAMIIAIRALSLGARYDMKAKCPHCAAEFKFTVDMSELDVNEPSDPKRRVYEVQLPPGGKYKVVKWHVMTGADEIELERLRSKSKDSPMTALIAVRVREVDGQKLSLSSAGGRKKMMSLLKSLRLRDRVALRASFEEHEGSLDMDFEYDCPECGKEINGRIDVGQPGFFFPQAT